MMSLEQRLLLVFGTRLAVVKEVADTAFLVRTVEADEGLLG